MILINHASAQVRKERFSQTSKARMKASQNRFMKKSEMPDNVKNLREVNHPRTQLGFKPIRNGLRKIKNLMENRLSRVETGLAGRENEVTLHKEEHMRYNDTFKQL